MGIDIKGGTITFDSHFDLVKITKENTKLDILPNWAQDLQLEDRQRTIHEIARLCAIGHSFSSVFKRLGDSKLGGACL